MTGIFLWFPKKAKNWKQGLKVKWDGNWKRINHDLHNTLAFYSLIALFIMAVKLHLVNSLYALIVPALVTAFGVFWMRQIIDAQIPNEIRSKTLS